MGDAAIAIAFLGFVVGGFFRMKSLVLLVILLTVFSIIFAFEKGSSWWATLLIILAVQCIFQTSYFLGLLCRVVLIKRNQRPPSSTGGRHTGGRHTGGGHIDRRRAAQGPSSKNSRCQAF